MTQKQDRESRVSVAGIVNGVILLLILLIIGLWPVRAGLGRFESEQGGASSSGVFNSTVSAAVLAQPVSLVDMAAGVAAPPASEADSSASIAAEPDAVTFYFVSGSADLAPGAQQALADIVRGVAAGQRAVVRGYRDATGNAGANKALAQRRAQAVQGALESLGIGDDKIDLLKPQATTRSGSDEQARRVEVTLQ
ncbi:MAG: OmpA family protein [Burkholderiaceae bacterium]|jgi:outer membrane protein OmpA-like peptidoglycan-associated protein|nr:OmpA family protein [Burkholderiaceae bacterium]